MPKKRRRQNFEKVGVDFLFQKKKFRNFLVSSLLMPGFVKGYFWALLGQKKVSVPAFVRACVRACVCPSIGCLLVSPLFFTQIA
jgi:fructose-specific phosphotransferase system IIC component